MKLGVKTLGSSPVLPKKKKKVTSMMIIAGQIITCLIRELLGNEK